MTLATLLRKVVTKLMSKFGGDAMKNLADLEAWEAYCEASLNLSNQDDVGENAPWLDCTDGFKDLPDEDADLDAQIDEKLAPTKAAGVPWS